MCCVGNSCGNCCVGNCSDCGGKAKRELKERHEKQIAEELASHRKEEANNAEVLEKDIVNKLNTAISEFINILEEQNNKTFGNKKLNINIQKVKQQHKALNDQIVGFIGRQMNLRLVPTDPELSVILSEMDDGKRNRNFNDFVNRVYESARKKLESKVENVMSEIEKIIRHEVESRLKEVETSLRKADQQYRTIMETDKNDSKKLDSLKLGHMYQSDLYRIMAKY